jgi:hypothetical protein
MFQAQVDAIRATTTHDKTTYAVAINGHLFSFRDDEILRIGIRIVASKMVPIRIPVLDPKQPNLLVAFALAPRDVQQMIDGGLSMRFVAHSVPRPLCSVS